MKIIKKVNLVRIIRSEWTDTQTVNFIGMTGIIETTEANYMDIYFKDLSEIITFHKSECVNENN